MSPPEAAPPQSQPPSANGALENSNVDGRLVAIQDKKGAAPPPQPQSRPPSGSPLNGVLGSLANASADGRLASVLQDPSSNADSEPAALPEKAIKPGQRARSLTPTESLKPISPKQLTPKARSQMSKSTPSLKGSAGGPSKYKTSAKFERFLQRQAGDHKTQIRRNLCKVHQQLIKDAEADMNSGNWGFHGAEGLRKKLIVHSGSVAAAWRNFLDPDDTGSLSFSGLVVKLEQMGFGGHLKKLWSELDTDEDGFISLADLDPQAAAVLGDFRSRVLDAYGSTLEWWQHITKHTPGAKRLSDEQFTKACQELGYADHASIDLAFRYLRFRQGTHKFLTLEEIDPQAAFALKRADPCAEGIAAGMGRSSPCLTPWGGGDSEVKAKVKAYRAGNSASNTLTNTSSPPSAQTTMTPIREGQPLAVDEHTNRSQERHRPESLRDSLMNTAPGNLMSPASRSGPLSPQKQPHVGVTTPTRQTRWIRTVSEVQRENLRNDKETFMNLLKGTKDLAQMKHNFINKYTNLYDAWREGFGFEDEKGRLNFVEFCEAVRSMGYVGSLKTLFAELDTKNTGFVSLREFAPATYNMIATYKEMLQEKHGNVAKAWLETFGTADAQAKVDEKEFVKSVEALGWQGDAKKLFKLMQSNPRGKFLFLRDFDPPAFKAIVRQDPEMISEEFKPTAPPSEMSFDERQEQTFRMKWSKHQSNLHRTEMAEAAQAEREKTLAAGDLKSLKRQLRVKWGSVGLAWKNILDVDSHGRLSWTSFANAMRRVGYFGDLLALWKELDKEGVGYITLGMFDKEVDDALTNFRQQLAEKYGNLIAGFRLGLDVGRAGRVEEVEFIKRFQELGFEGDPVLIFKNLQAWNGRKFITLGDVEPRHIEAYYRDDEAAMTVLMPHDQGVEFTPKGLVSNPASPNSTAAGKMFQNTELNNQSSPSQGSPPSSPSTRKRAESTGIPEEDGDSATESAMSPASHNTTMYKTMSDANSSNYKTTHLSTWCRDIGHRYRKKLEKMNKEEKDKHMGCKTLEELRRVLVRRYGSIVTAWKASLDADGNGRLSFNEFCIVLRKNSFIGHLKDLWTRLGGDEHGFVSLKALDKDSWDRVVEIRDIFINEFGGVRPAWSFLAGDAAWIEEDVFGAKMQELGWDPGPDKVHQVFLDLMCEKGKRYMYPEDLKALLIGIPTHMQERTWLGPKRPQPKVPWQDNAARALDNLKSVMIKKFGCIYVGWWKAFDLDGSGSLPVKDFILRANGIGFAGNMKGLLKFLGVTEKDRVTLKSIDPEVASRIELFGKHVDAKYGSFKAAWVEAMDDGSGMLDLPTFKEFCEQVGYPDDAKVLFRTFKPEETLFDVSGTQVDRKHVYFEDFGPFGFGDSGMNPSARRGFLKECGIVSPKDRMPRHIFARPGDPAGKFPLSGASPRRCETYPSQAYTAQTRGVSAPPSPTNSQSVSRMGPDRGTEHPCSPARHAAYFGNKAGKDNDYLERSRSARHVEKEEDTKRALAEFAAAQAEFASHDKGAKDAKTLKQALLHKFGTLTSAWRHGLDLDGNNRISFNEFCEAVRRIAFSGNIKTCFAELDKDGKHLISFEDFAPEDAKLLKEFSKLIRDQYGSYAGAFAVLDDNNNGWLEEAEIVNICQSLGYSGDGKYLFKLLRNQKGMIHVTLSDLEQVMRPIPECR